MRKLYKVGWCPFCEQGWIIIVKDINTSELNLCCTECETHWENPYELYEEHCLKTNKYGKYEIPAEDEIINSGWSEFLKGDSLK